MGHKYKDRYNRMVYRSTSRLKLHLVKLLIVFGIVCAVFISLVATTQSTYSYADKLDADYIPLDQSNSLRVSTEFEGPIPLQPVVLESTELRQEDTRESPNSSIGESVDQEGYNDYTSSAYSASPGSLKYDGMQSDENFTYTWYSENVLPGGGLNIPGRHSDDGGFIRDGEDNIVVASSDLAYGTVVETPYGTAKVYDSGCDSGILDVYTSW